MFSVLGGSLLERSDLRHSESEHRLFLRLSVVFPADGEKLRCDDHDNDDPSSSTAVHIEPVCQQWDLFRHERNDVHLRV